MLGLEHRDQIFVAEFILRSVCLDVVPVFWGSLDVHHSRIPFAAKSGNRICAPVDKNSELRIFVPLRSFVILQRHPVGAIGPFTTPVFDVFQERCALRVILAAGLLPDFIDLFRRL